jgi:uncharacterized protein (UPF0332 family)
VTPEAARDLAKAREDLIDARQIAGIGLATPAARSAYYAAFHAAQAMIFDRTGRVARTHAGVRSEFARLAKGDGRIDRSMTTFLAKAYQYRKSAITPLIPQLLQRWGMPKPQSRRPLILLTAYGRS